MQKPEGAAETLKRAVQFKEDQRSRAESILVQARLPRDMYYQAFKILSANRLSWTDFLRAQVHLLIEEELHGHHGNDASAL